MKIRNGFVSNSSSCSYTIYYNDGDLLVGAQEILDYLESHDRAEVYLLGKELGEGDDFTYISSQMKKMIVRFRDEWLRNGDKVKALVKENRTPFTMVSEYDRNHNRDALKERYAHNLKFLKDNSRYMDDESLEEFYAIYIMDDVPYEYEVSKLSNVKPYAIIHRDKIAIEDEEQWKCIIDDPDSYPLVITKRDRDKDFIRTLKETNGVPDYDISYIDAFHFSDSKENREFLRGIYKKVHKKGVVIYRDAFFCRNSDAPHFYPLIFHVEPMFGVYKMHDDRNQIGRLL